MLALSRRSGCLASTLPRVTNCYQPRTGLDSGHRLNVLQSLHSRLHLRRNFWSRRKVDPDFTYSFVDEIINHWDLDWILPGLAPKLKKYCQDLGIWDEDAEKVDHRFHVETAGSETLKQLPDRLPHAGKYEWVGEVSKEPPKWVWDSKTGRTVRTTRKILREGYIAVSYTWGRWRVEDGWRRIEGVPWEVPAVKPEGCDIVDLLPVLAKVPGTRYYWIDVLCINQRDHVERQQEISKQGSIFDMAKGTFIYLWTVPNGHNLALALCHLGDSVLWQLRISPWQQFLALKCNATYQERRYSKGPKEDRSVTPFAWKLQADPWFSSLWTMQEMVLCPSAVLMARNGEFCTINGRLATLARMATAISLANEVMMIRSLLPEFDSFMSYLPRKVTSYAMDKSREGGIFGAAGDRTMDAISALRSHPRHEWMLRTRTSIWTEWNADHCLDISLTADRSDILGAVTKRVATERRGEAIIAAMKVAPFEGAFDDDGVTASGIPPGLLEKIMRVQGRSLFMNVATVASDDMSGFFSHISPQSYDMPMRQDLEGGGKGTHGYEGLSAQDWSITADERLRIPQGSQLQVPDSRKVSITLNGNEMDGKVIWDMRTAPAKIAAAYRKRMRRLSWWESVARAYDLQSPPQDPFDDDDIPRDIEVRFLPLAVLREPEDTKVITMQARKDPIYTLLFRFLGLNLGVDDRVAGIVLASGSRADTGRPKEWYKCGNYLSYGTFTPHGVPEVEGMTVGRL